jgi:cell division septation protein DedD
MPPEPPDEAPVPPPKPPLDAGGTCPRCGTPYEPYQEYCLECGLRLPSSGGVVAVLAHHWRRRLPWYPGDWIWPVLLGLVIAALAAAGAILATRDDDGSPSSTKVATGPATVPGETVPSETTPTGTGAEPPPPTGTETEPVEPEPPPPPTGPGGLVEWPPGQTGYTIVLASLPASAGRAAAIRAGQKAAQAGLSDVGALNSSDYSSLHPGYWVVFTGIYDTLDEAKSALDTARGTYPQAYTRQIAQ